MENALHEWAAARGYQVAWADGSIVEDGLERVRRLRDEGAFDPAFFDSLLGWMMEPGPRGERWRGSVILAAVPRPAHVVKFDSGDGRDVDLVLPPTYHRYYPLFDDVLADLDGFTGRRLSPRLLKAPLKTLAAMTGLVRYGRNNLVYVDGFGSYLQLMGFSTETRLAAWEPEEGFGKVGAQTDGAGTGPRPASALSLDECRTCRACRKACPAGAVAGDRFLLRGERCLTALSEADGPALPEVYGKLPTRCLIGCLACQERCPANKGRLRFERLDVRFTAGETAYLAGERGDGAPSPELTEKVRALACTDLTISNEGAGSILRRNLRSLLNVP